MKTQTKRNLINWASVLWGLIAVLSLIDKDSTFEGLGLSQITINWIKYIAPAIVIFLQAFKPNSQIVEETTITHKKDLE